MVERWEVGKAACNLSTGHGDGWVYMPQLVASARFRVPSLCRSDADFAAPVN